MTGISSQRFSLRARRPGASLLLVDDDDDSREAIARLLTFAGYLVTSCANGSRALDALRSGGKLPDVILLDIMMPDMDGRAFRAAQRADGRLARIPVIILSAQGDLRATIDADAYLDKPLEYTSLVDTIDRTIEARVRSTGRMAAAAPSLK